VPFLVSELEMLVHTCKKFHCTLGFVTLFSYIISILSFVHAGTDESEPTSTVFRSANLQTLHFKYLFNKYT